MTISSTTRSIEIDAPVEEVLAFIADPYRRMPAQERDYVFLLNGYDEEVPESPDRKNSVVAWDDVNTFTLELSGEPEGTEDGCRYALFSRDGPEGFFLAHLGDNNVGSVDVDGDPAIAFVTDCIPSRAIAFQ